MSNAPERRARFGPALRLGHKREFDAVYQARARVERGPLIVHALPNTLGHPRLGLSVGRRFGGAVRRNRMKRKLREAFRLSQAEFPGDYDVVIGVRPHADAPLGHYQTYLLDALRHLHTTWTKRRTRAARITEQVKDAHPPACPPPPVSPPGD